MASYIKGKIDNLLATITNPTFKKNQVTQTLTVVPTSPAIKSYFTKRPILTSEPYIHEQTKTKNMNKF